MRIKLTHKFEFLCYEIKLKRLFKKQMCFLGNGCKDFKVNQREAVKQKGREHSLKIAEA